MSLTREVEAFCIEHGIAPTRFGSLALRDNSFIPSLHAGRRCGPHTEGRVRAWMAENRGKDLKPRQLIRPPQQNQANKRVGEPLGIDERARDSAAARDNKAFLKRLWEVHPRILNTLARKYPAQVVRP